MRFWVSHNTSTPISEQLKAQFILGILSKRLAPGGRLPSVRQLARQLRIHPNTVSGVYRELAQKGWVDARKGSGVFVRAHDGDGVGSSIEAFVRFCITQAEALGYSVEDVRAALDRVALDRANETRQSYSFVLTDPDEEFARVLAAEISDATGLSLESVPLNTLMDHLTPETCVLINPAYANKLPSGVRHRGIRLNSMQDVILGQQRPAKPILIGVVSRSDEILKWSERLLSALGFSPDCVICRNPRLPAWQEGLGVCDLIGADIIAAQELPRGVTPVVFRLVAQDSVSEIRDAMTFRRA